MKATQIPALVAAFFAGALLMLVIRGSGTTERVAADVSDTGPTSDAERHAAQLGDQETAPDAQTGAQHGDHAEPAKSDPKPVSDAKGASQETAPGPTFVAWVCADNDQIGLSEAGICPTDGSPLVERTLQTGSYQDLRNEKCPVMGGQTKPNIFALYGGKKIRFCCPSCGPGFFDKAQAYLDGLGASADEARTKMWVCEQDPSYGSSDAAKCPLDGKPMVEREVDLSGIVDVKNKP
ncbi:MAG: hypothetical protein AUK47_06395 [Deltaproteobacteria bacterium CG2_30_63_29]|nr:MAG: hypothetical protein AUK47_06395 [Deltaproteobacteria bacterium CG2_30_63_29]